MQSLLAAFSASKQLKYDLETLDLKSLMKWKQVSVGVGLLRAEKVDGVIDITDRQTIMLFGGTKGYLALEYTKEGEFGSAYCSYAGFPKTNREALLMKQFGNKLYTSEIGQKYISKIIDLDSYKNQNNFK